MGPAGLAEGALLTGLMLTCTVTGVETVRAVSVTVKVKLAKGASSSHR